MALVKSARRFGFGGRRLSEEPTGASATTMGGGRRADGGVGTTLGNDRKADGGVGTTWGDAGDGELEFFGEVAEGGDGAGGFVEALDAEVHGFAVAGVDEGVADGQGVEAPPFRRETRSRMV